MNKHKLSYAETPHEIKNWKYGYPKHLYEKLLNKMLMNEFNSQICTTIEQSQRLLALGLKPETSDMCWLNTSNLPACAGYTVFKKAEDEYKLNITPAWSMHRLLCLLYPREDVYPIMPSTAYDDIIDDIENEIKCGGFNKEYLKQ